MIKYSLTFLAGTAFSTVLMISAGGRAAQFIGLGFLLTVALTAGVLWLTGVRRLARFLNAFMDGIEGVAARPATKRAVSVVDRISRHRESIGYVKPSTKQRDRILEDTMEEYLGDDLFAPTKSERTVN